MKTLVCLGVALGLIAVASALTCNICKFRALSICFTNAKTESCNGTCSTTKTSISKFSLFTKQDCATECKATNSSKDSVFDFDYTTTCCKTDRCNSGNSLKISFSLGLGMVLLWLLNAM